MKVLHTIIRLVGVRYFYKHKNFKTKQKMQFKLDGSEASMLPVIAENSYLIFGKKNNKDLIGLNEFTVGRGIADYFVFEQDKPQLRQRQRRHFNAVVDFNVLVELYEQEAVRLPSVIRSSVAIEAKVKDWRKGLKQAMRYKSFADRSYLAVYEAHVQAPVQYLDIFHALNIGLISVSDTGIDILFDPVNNKVDDRKYLLASERAYSIIDDTQDSFVIRNQLVPNGVAA